ncbi:MAG: hypothetical protein OXH00_02915 [Candidatus Poribacteria bacterium]|nr:hypothetical protein [Candidatus Poribacteria bacterium]
MRKKRIKPPQSFEVTRRKSVERPNAYDLPLEMLSIVEWHPDLNAELPPEQVHLVIKLGGESEADKLDLLLRFQSPEALGFVIEELIAYRKRVWADAEPINPDAEVED